MIRLIVRTRPAHGDARRYRAGLGPFGREPLDVEVTPAQAEALRADPAQAGLRIVMLTAKGRDTEVAKGLAIGADAYVTKPFSTKDLVAQVKTMLGA